MMLGRSQLDTQPQLRLQALTVISFTHLAQTASTHGAMLWRIADKDVKYKFVIANAGGGNTVTFKVTVAK